MKLHRIDLVSAFFGFVFLGLGVVILAGNGDVTLRYLTVLGPVLLVAFGLVLVAAAVRRQRPKPQPVEEVRPSYSFSSYTAPLEHPAAQANQGRLSDEPRTSGPLSDEPMTSGPLSDEPMTDEQADEDEAAPYDAGDET